MWSYGMKYAVLETNHQVHKGIHQEIWTWRGKDEQNSHGYHKKLDKDEQGINVDIKLYRSMIGSLLYLTVSRPDIIFSACLCARFQYCPKESHLIAVKCIIRYLKGTIGMGLWFSKT